MNGFAIHHCPRDLIGDCLSRIRLAIDEFVFDLVQRELDRRTGSDGYCQTCGCKPLTMGHRGQISAPAIMYADDAAENERLHDELRKTRVERNSLGKTACGRTR